MHPGFEIDLPMTSAVPVVFDSPHSGSQAPSDWKPVAVRDALLTSWDAFVDELFAAAPQNGATLLRALFPRTFIDLNRARDDIDADMIDGEFDAPLNPGPKSSVGMGLLRRFALPGVPVYDRKLSSETVAAWIRTYYDPYHLVLRSRLDELHARFGFVRHIDCHSMKSRGNAMNDDAGRPRPDIVVSDRDGTTSDPEFTNDVAALFRARGYKTTINEPYKGAELIARYGDPARNRSSIQIEINRAIYMVEKTFEKGPDFDRVKADISGVIADICSQIGDATTSPGRA